MSQSLPTLNESTQQRPASTGKPRRALRLPSIALAAVAIFIVLRTIVGLAQPEINTSTDTLVVTKARLTDRFPLGCTSSEPSCLVANPGYQVLIIWLESKSKSGGDVHVPQGISVVSANGSTAESFGEQWTMSSPWIALAYAVHDSERKFHIQVPGNPVVDLDPVLFFIP